LYELSVLDIEERLNEAISKGGLPDVRFHVLGLNVWSDENLPPAELTLVEFSLAQGVTAVFSKKMKPVRMPLGFLADAKASHPLVLQLLEAVRSAVFPVRPFCFFCTVYIEMLYLS
jgi:hypothetical protein